MVPIRRSMLDRPSCSSERIGETTRSFALMRSTMVWRSRTLTLRNRFHRKILEHAAVTQLIDTQEIKLFFHFEIIDPAPQDPTRIQHMPKIQNTQLRLSISLQCCAARWYPAY